MMVARLISFLSCQKAFAHNDGRLGVLARVRHPDDPSKYLTFRIDSVTYVPEINKISIELEPIK